MTASHDDEPRMPVEPGDVCNKCCEGMYEYFIPEFTSEDVTLELADRDFVRCSGCGIVFDDNGVMYLG